MTEPVLCRCRGARVLGCRPELITETGANIGTVARQWYEELGGEVVLLGKPAAVLYEEALRLLGLRKDEVLAIGDSLQHDIAGAALAAAARRRMIVCHWSAISKSRAVSRLHVALQLHAAIPSRSVSGRAKGQRSY